MSIKDAIVIRFQELCKKEGITYNELANRAGITPSTVYSMMDETRQDLSIITIKVLCDGLDVKLAQFFDAPVFDNLEQEVK